MEAQQKQVLPLVLIVQEPEAQPFGEGPASPAPPRVFY